MSKYNKLASPSHVLKNTLKLSPDLNTFTTYLIEINKQLNTLSNNLKPDFLIWLSQTIGRKPNINEFQEFTIQLDKISSEEKLNFLRYIAINTLKIKPNLELQDFKQIINEITTTRINRWKELDIPFLVRIQRILNDNPNAEDIKREIEEQLKTE
jgi:hypothetical protein